MYKFRKKPIVIEAVQFNDFKSYLKIFEWMKKFYDDSNTLTDKVRYSSPIMFIETLEGTMTANPSDWIIKGVKNEFYPCKDEIFLATYEKYD